MQRKSNETLCKEKEQSVPALAQALVVAMETANSYAVGSTAGGGAGGGGGGGIYVKVRWRGHDVICHNNKINSISNLFKSPSFTEPSQCCYYYAVYLQEYTSTHYCSLDLVNYSRLLLAI